MNWRCPPWRIVRPIDAWLHGYAAWLAVVDLPGEIVNTLNLAAPPATAASFVPTPRPGLPCRRRLGEVFSSACGGSLARAGWR